MRAFQLGMAMHGCNPSPEKAEEAEGVCVLEQPELRSQTLYLKEIRKRDRQSERKIDKGERESARKDELQR